MFRYFFEIAYKGTNYKGLQRQRNANSIEAELLSAFTTYFKRNPFSLLTSASRTDAGVHAQQNFFHIDFEQHLSQLHKDLYHLNAILPQDIVMNHAYAVNPHSHARFDALDRTYEYTISFTKNPFLQEMAMYHPYPLKMSLLQDAATFIQEQKNFMSFCKKHAQNHTYDCNIMLSEWRSIPNGLVYVVTANRFLRGMIRALVGTMLLLAREKISLQQFEDFFTQQKIASADFSPDAKGLCLVAISYDDNIKLTHPI